MTLFIYGIVASVGILGLSSYFFPQFKNELFFGWLGPLLSGVATIYFVLRAAKADIRTTTKVLVIGFVAKLTFYGAYVMLLGKLYSFEPLPLICSFSGFFLGFHALEAVIINNLSK